MLWVSFFLGQPWLLNRRMGGPKGCILHQNTLGGLLLHGMVAHLEDWALRSDRFTNVLFIRKYSVHLKYMFDELHILPTCLH